MKHKKKIIFVIIIILLILVGFTKITKRTEIINEIRIDNEVDNSK
jgi:uncharacterized membrane-anchored protein